MIHFEPHQARKVPVGTATQVAEWYEEITGYRFNPTVIGQMYARRNMVPGINADTGEKIYNGVMILDGLEALRKRRQRNGP